MDTPPEQFWVDKSQCRYTDEQGQTQNPTQADCAQGVSAVKAIAIAQAEGQRIYTINQSNAATALPKLPVGGTVGQEIASAIQAGKEVTVHERQINAHGWTGYGYVITDPETGAGGYIIEGRGNGGAIEPPAWFNNVVSALVNFMGGVANQLMALLGTFLGLLFNALDALDALDVLNSGCYDAGEAFIRAVAFVYFVSAFGLLLGFAVAGMGVLLGIVAAVFLVVFSSVVKDAFMNCPIARRAIYV